MEEEEEDWGVRVTGMRYTIVLTVNVYSHVDRFFKEKISNLLSMLSHCFKTRGVSLLPIIVRGLP